MRVYELVGIGDSPLLTEEGWTRDQEKWCEATSFGADGVVAHKRRCGMHSETLYVSDHPVCAASVALRHFLTGAATPPHRGGDYRVIYTLRQFVQRFMAYRTFDNGAH